VLLGERDRLLTAADVAGLRERVAALLERASTAPAG
jgi:hypothetical protein